MRGFARPSAAAALVVLFALAACRAGSGSRQAEAPPAARAAANLLVITIDTLRADHVGAYGASEARTPVMDATAAEGVRFDRAYAAAPITLTSHASLLTGRYPPGHGARNNGMRMQPVPTLATILHARRFATAAFVAAFPLDRRFGLADGFDTYSDVLPRGSDGRPLDERPAPVVADEAIAWLTAHRGGGRFFAWVHFFEPHAPYGPPGETTGRPPRARYDDEIAIADREAGRVIAALGPQAASTIVVIAGDHGEAFGEHGEVSHSVFAYDTTLRVPLLMKGPGLGGARAVVRGPVSLVDVAPTVLAALGVRGSDSDGIDLRPTIASGRAPADRLLYAESFAPLCDFGWSSLRTVRSGPWKYIAAPRPELYDLAADPDETTSVIATHRDVAAALDARAGGFSAAELPAAAAQAAARDPEAVRRLGALGYVSGSRAVASRRADPKDRRQLARDLALVFSGELRGQALKDALASILRQDPDNAQAHQRLGYVLLGEGRTRDAEPHFRGALRAGLRSADAWMGLASCAGARGDVREAEALLRQADGAEPGNPVVAANLGVLFSRTGRHAEAIDRLTRVVAGDPQFDEARFNLALAYARAGRRLDALNEARTLLGRLPAGAPQRGEVARLVATLAGED